MRKFLVFIISFITLCANTAVFAQINGQEAINSVENIEIQTENTQQVKTGETKQQRSEHTWKTNLTAPNAAATVTLPPTLTPAPLAACCWIQHEPQTAVAVT